MIGLLQLCGREGKNQRNLEDYTIKKWRTPVFVPQTMHWAMLFALSLETCSCLNLIWCSHPSRNKTVGSGDWMTFR